MFFIFIILSLIIALAAGIYICLCTRRLLEFYGADIKKKWVKTANIIISIVLAGLCMPLFTNTAVIILHLVASFLFFDIIAYLCFFNLITIGRANTPKIKVDIIEEMHTLPKMLSC